MAAFAHPSPALLAANRRLLQLRAERQEAGDTRLAARPFAANGGQETAAAAALPAHLGWDSPAVTAVLRGENRQQ
ncbi:MAG: hypothetical protein KC425_00415, partial [Anaerolineales bacterium]|nr:hypothetical protein [Anaerolineales bacterium]